jgi:hypothetical protein
VSQAGRNNWRSPCLSGSCYYGQSHLQHYLNFI